MVKIEKYGQVVIRGTNGEVRHCSTIDEVNEAFHSFIKDGARVRMIGMQVDDEETECLTRLDFGQKRAKFSVTVEDKRGCTTESSVPIPDLHGVSSDTDGTLLVNEKWLDIFALIKDMDTRTAAWVAGVRMIQVEDNKLILDFRSEKHVMEISSPRHTDVLVGAIRVVTGLNLEIVARYIKEDAA